MTSNAHPPYGYSGSQEPAPADTSRAERLLKVIEVARLLRVHRNTVRNLIRCGDLSSVQVLNQLRVPAADVIRYLERHQSMLGANRPRGHRKRRGHSSRQHRAQRLGTQEPA